ncbi:MAG: polymer-forming cytoskeletal protein, partial [candidate division Zixibacteria bacterium]|nr:polymer-forming cytoskeletal protein [candidate division Zixibacteria bacterium]
ANLFGYRVDLYGKTNRSARLFGYMINTNGDIGGNLMVFGNDASIGEKSIIKRDFLCRAQRVNIDGTVQGNANIAAANVVISGTIEGNADITAEKLMIVPPAIIKGYLHYTSRNEAVIEEGSVITGDKRWKLPEVKKEDEEGVSFLSAIFRFALFVMALVTGLVLILFFREHTRESSRQIEKSFWVTLATGCLAFIVFTFGAIILLVLIIGIPLALLLISLGMTLFYVGKIYLSIALGRWIFRLFRPHREFAIGFELLLGLIVLTILFQLPYLGCLIYIITALIGMGAAIRGYHAINHKYKTAIAAPTPAGIA